MIPYMGGKANMSEWIGGFIPQEFDTYVEVFGGAFWVYINGSIHKKRSLERIIYNDFNRFMTNLFECCSNPDEFYQRIKDVKVQDPDLFDQYQKEINSIECFESFDLGDYDLGLKYSYIATQVFSGSKIMTSPFQDIKEQTCKFDNFRDRLVNYKMKEKLERITKCENLDFRDVIKKYDSPGTFFYVDPPYWKTEGYYSNKNFDQEDHEVLINQLKGISGKFALSYYEFDLLNELLPKDQYLWESKNYTKCSSAQKGSTPQKGTEVLIMNYEIPQLKLF
tara:strand:+ start:20687 stop:21523 length:837 start_codon:yes stop_codon:yes gene_type:complete